MVRWISLSTLVFSILLGVLSASRRPERTPPARSLTPRQTAGGGVPQRAVERAVAAPRIRYRRAGTTGFFARNDGQWDPRARFGLQDRNVSLFFTDDGYTLTSTNGIALKSKFVGGRSVRPKGEGSGRAGVTYFVGDKVVSPEVVQAIRYPGVWPGVDIVYEVRKDGIEYVLELQPGADPNRIRFAWEGALPNGTDTRGNLLLSTPGGTLRETRPKAFQDDRDVEANFHLHGDGTYGFTLAEYDSSRPLLIDPILMYSTYLHGTGSTQESANDIRMDSGGNIYIAGTATSGFPTTAGVYDPTANGSTDTFVMKLDVDGVLLWSTYIGGSGADTGSGISFDGSGNVYLMGITNSADLPANVGITTFPGVSDLFIARLASNGSSLTWLTYMGGSGSEFAFAPTFAADAAGNTYFAGVTTSTDLPATAGAFSSTLTGAFDVFVGQIDPAGTPGWLTYLGGTSIEYPGDLVVDGSGNVTLTGSTGSGSTNDFPTTPGAYDTTYNELNLGGSDGFVARINSGGGLGWSTYLGGWLQDWGSGVALDPVTGDVLVTGKGTYSAIGAPYTPFPATPGTLDTVNNNATKAYVARLSGDGTTLLWSTFLGSATGNTEGKGVDVGPNGEIIVTGNTTSTSFPVTADAVQSNNAGGQDVFVSILSPDGVSLVWSTYFGGSGTDTAVSLHVDSVGSIAVSGNTASLDFPMTPGSVQSTADGGTDGFIALFGTVRVLNVTTTTPDGIYSTPGVTMDIDITYSKPVFVTGTPQLTLETGVIDAVANYIGGSGSSTLTFQYVLAAGHASPDLDYASNGALALNGGTIRNVAGNDASVILPPPGSPGSLGANKDIQIETTPPVAGSVNDGPGADIDAQLSRTTLSANWSGFSDPETGVVDYEWAIGTTPGGTDLQGFVSVGLATSVLNATVSLVDGSRAYVTVRATNGIGLQSSATSDGFTVGSNGSFGRKAPSCSATSEGSKAPIILLLVLLLIGIRHWVPGNGRISG